MEGKFRKNDFVELKYTGKIKDTNEIFDTNIEEEAEKINLDIKTKPLIICLGQNMILPSIDEFLINKKIGAYTLELTPKQAFGARDSRLIKIMPLSVFSKHNITPEKGMVFTFDNMFGKTISKSGGRVIVDFNNPIAGKKIVYELKIKKKISDINEKIKALILVFFRKELDFEVKDKKLIIKAEKEALRFLNLFKSKFKEILDLDLEIKVPEKTENLRT